MLGEATALGIRAAGISVEIIANIDLTVRAYRFASADAAFHQMMKSWHVLKLLGYAALFGAGTVAHAGSVMTVETTVYEWTEEADSDDSFAEYAQPSQAIASYGPFNVVAPDRAELYGEIDSDAPAQFAAMLRSYPGIKQLVMVDCPGTDDDEANFKVAHMLRKAGIATYVPDGGSVRSGGVELFLAGVKRQAAPDAEFAVHSWIDSDGMEAKDFAANDPVHQSYLKFYREVGMSSDQARAFYDMTNSTPNGDAHYLHGRDIAAYIPLD